MKTYLVIIGKLLRIAATALHLQLKKNFELITIPIAFLLLLGWNKIAVFFGWHDFTWEMFGKVFAAFLMFLVSLGFLRIVYMTMFKKVYKYFDTDFDEFKTSWTELKPVEKVFFALFLFYVLSDLFKQILNGL